MEKVNTNPKEVEPLLPNSKPHLLEQTFHLQTQRESGSKDEEAILCTTLTETKISNNENSDTFEDHSVYFHGGFQNVYHGPVTVAQIVSNTTHNHRCKKIHFNVRDPTTTFTGRKDYLNELNEAIQKNKSETLMTVLSQTSVITGLGGIGKTETVRMYIYLYGKNYQHIVWIDAENNTVAEAQFRKLASQELEISSTDFDSKPKEFDDIISDIYKKLCSMDTLLLIFDNAETIDNDKEGIRRFLPKSLPVSFIKPSILVTSRNQNWAQQKVIQLGMWSKEDSVEFVMKQLQLEDTEENISQASKLAQFFGQFPLAIHAAVAVILQQSKRNNLMGKQNYGIDDIIRDYKEGKRDVLKEHSLDSSSKTTMMVLWNVTINKIKCYEYGELAIKVLHMMAYLSPTGIPKEFLLELFANEADAFPNALDLLTSYSLVEDLQNRSSLSIHRMIQDVLIENLKMHAKRFSIRFCCCFKRKFYLTLEEEILYEFLYKTRLYLALLPKTCTVHDEIITNVVHATYNFFRAITVFPLEVLTCIENIINEIQYFRLDDAYQFYEFLCVRATSLKGNERRYLHKYRSNLALILYLKAMFEKALEMWTEIYEEQKQAWGARDEETVMTMYYIAMALDGNGKLDEALEVYLQVSQIHEEILDPLHPDVLATKNNIAIVFNKQGRMDEAIGIYKQIISAQEQISGPDHPNSLAMKYNLACAMDSRGLYSEATALFLEVANKQTNVLGANHSRTLSTMNRVALLMEKQGQSEEAIKILRKVHTAREQTLGPNHPSTIATKIDIFGLDHVDQNKISCYAAQIYSDIQNLYKDNKDNLINLNFLKNVLAVSLSKQGKFMEAIDLYLDVLKSQESDQPREAMYPDKLISQHNLASVYYDIGDYQNAFTLAEKVMQLRMKRLGEKHPEYLQSKRLFEKSQMMLKKD